MNFGDLLDYTDEQLAPTTVRIVEQTASGVQRTVTAAELKRASNNLARKLVELGAQPGDKAAFFATNSADYLIGLVAVLKARLVHVNINYRYAADELRYVLDNSDAKFVLFGSGFGDVLKAVVADCVQCEHCIEIHVDTPQHDWAHSLRELCEQGDGEPLQITRSPEDLFFVYTGGTTGMPKGVMWEQSQLWKVVGRFYIGIDEPTPRECKDIVIPPKGGKLNNLLVLPLMHGAGVYTAIAALGYGNACIMPMSVGFDADLALTCIDKHQVMVLTISGDAFAQPLIAALQANPGKYNLNSLKSVTSSAMIFSPHNKKALLDKVPGLRIFDTLGSSESPAGARIIHDKDSDLETSLVVLKLTPNTKVFTEDLREVKPGSGEQGFVATTGALPLGYYKDEKKTAETFITVDGVRYSRPGDWVEVLEDGSIRFLGRGSVCVNSGGEKIYPDEVESVIKSHKDVEDCVVVGVTDARFGQALTALIHTAQGVTVDTSTIQDHVRSKLAGYKVPRHVLFVEKVYRSPNGKLDYPAAKALAESRISGH